MYEVLNGFSANDTFIRSHNPPLSFDDAVEILIRDTWSIRHHWIFEYDVSTRAMPYFQCLPVKIPGLINLV